MTDQQMQKLEALRNYGTRYEAVVVRGDGEQRLLAYLGRHSLQGLYSATTQRGRAVLAFLVLPDDAQMTFARKSREIAITGGHTVKFTGRTQRDAISNGELAYIAA